MNIDDFARRIGVSTATVSRAIHGTGRVSEATRQMVLQKMDEIGYRPNQAARALATGRTTLVGLWLASLASAFYAEVIRHTHQQVTQGGFDMVIREIAEDETNSPASLTSWPVSGVLAMVSRTQTRNLVQAVSADDSRIPLVTMGTFAFDDTDYVRIDLAPGVAAAMEHLIASGRGRIAYLVPEYANTAGNTRRDGYAAALAGAGLEPEYIQVVDGSRATVRRVLRDYIEAHGWPEAIFCHSDDVAIGAYRTLRALGLRVPDDVALVGCDGIEEGEYLEVPLTTIAVPTRQMCGLAWQFLQRRIADPSLPPQQTVLEPELVIQGSSLA